MTATATEHRTSASVSSEPRTAVLGRQMHELIEELYPICRSITGDGVRQTLLVLQRYLPLELHEVPSGTRAFDWTVPQEWNIRDAYIKDLRGQRIVDFQQCNLHVVGYSVPVKKRVSLAELNEHIHSLPDQPDLVPYRTSYYHKNWGFCLSHRQRAALADAEYDVCIDSSLVAGSLTYGECFLPGESDEEVLLSCHVCHPSLCNDNLSGISLLTMLARRLALRPRRYGYRFLFIPGTIGSITWLSRNEERVKNIRHGLVAVCVGDPGNMTYKRSRQGNAEIDRAVEHVLSHSGDPHRLTDFTPYGYDERQYCSPGFDLPVGCLMRTPHGQFPQYHTSADDLDFVQPQSLADSYSKYAAVIELLEHNRTYRSRNMKCEPQLGRRGLYDAIGGRSDGAQFQLALLWVLNLSDGQHDLLGIANRANLPFDLIRQAAEALCEQALLELIA